MRVYRQITYFLLLAATLILSVSCGRIWGNFGSSNSSSSATEYSNVYPHPMLVQSANRNHSAGVTSLTANFPGSNYSGNMIIVACTYRNAGSQATTVTVTDTRGNTYTPIVDTSAATLGRGYLFYAANILAGANMVTCNYSGAENARMFIGEYSGLDVMNPLENSNSATASSANPSTTVTTTAANSVTVGVVDFTGASINIGAAPRKMFHRMTSSSGQSLYFQDGVEAAAGVKTVDLAGGLGAVRTWYMLAASFKAAAPATNVNRAAVYTIGGGAGGMLFPSTFKTYDGINWMALGELPVASHAACSLEFNNAIWYIGGSDFVTSFNTVYRSVDGGLSWSSAGTLPAVRDGHACVVFDNKMWVIGGSNNVNVTNGTSAQAQSTVYSSSNGSSWTAVGNIPVALILHSATVFNGKMWVAGGKNTAGTAQTAVYWSTDGITWSTAGAAGLPAGRHTGGMTTHNNLMWFIAGENTAGTHQDTVWSCSDPCGAWTVNTPLPFAATQFKSVSFQGNLTLMYGYDLNVNPNYTSPSGGQWTSLENVFYAQRYYNTSMVALGTSSPLVTYMQTAQNQATAAASTIVTGAFSNIVGQGNLLLCRIIYNSNSVVITGVTNTSGDTFVKATGPVLGTGSLAAWSSEIWYAPNIAGAAAGAMTVTATFGSAFGTNKHITCNEFYGADLTSPIDAINYKTGSSANASMTLQTSAYQTIFAGGKFATTGTNGGGFAQLSSLTGQATQAAFFPVAGTQDVVFTNTAMDWLIHAVAIKAK